MSNSVFDILPPMTPRTALGGLEPAIEAHGPIVLSEMTEFALASVAARLGQIAGCVSRMSDWLGTSAPDVEDFITSGSFNAFWMGPHQWMVCAPHNTYEDLATKLKAHLGETASVTEQNDAWVILDLQGDVTSVMELLCPINMERFPVGTARRTTIDHLGCFIVRLGNDNLRILGPRSSAGSLHHALMTAIRAAH